MEGWIKLYRQTWDNPIVCKDAEHLAVWVWLLTHVVAFPTDVKFGKDRITLKPGQMTTGRKQIANELHISESKVQRILKSFEIEHQIEQRTDHQCRLISIVSWDKYQHTEQGNEQQLNNDRTTSEQRVNTKRECKEGRDRENYYISYNTYEQTPVKTLDSLRNKYNNAGGLTAPEDWYLEGSR